VPAGDPLELARVLERILLDRALAERLGAAGRRLALAELTEERCLDRLLAIYEELAARPKMGGFPGAGP
jgi:glycosyltransferase involved in cell wall biosynthesis